ncbi:MFS transporter [Lentzea sp. NPDC055074]
MSRSSSTATETTSPARPAAAVLGLLATPTALSANATAMTLPGIARDVGVSVPTVTWIATAFGLAVAVSTPLMANLLRRNGPRLVLLSSAAFVALGTVVVAFGESMPLLIAGRGLQAFGGGGLVTLAINLAGTPKRMGVVTAGSGFCGALGPLAGSLLADHFSWHAALSLSALSLLAVPAALRSLPTFAGPRAQPPFDVLGAVTLVALISALVFLPRFPVPALLIAAALAALLAVRVRMRPDGFVPAVVLRTPTFLLVSLLVCVLSTSYFSLLYSVPRLLGHHPGWSTGQIGVGTMVVLLAGSAASWLLAAYSARLSRPVVLTILLVLGVAAPLSVLVSPFALVLLAAAGVAVFVAAAGQATLSLIAGGSVPAEQRPTALGLFTLCYQLGGAFGPAIAALLVTT